MQIVGVCGDKQHGKDTVARFLIELANEYGVRATRRAMADPLKEEIAECFAPRMGVTKHELLRQMNTTEEKERWRLIMQWWGTEYRRAEDPDYWVKQLDRWMQQHKKGYGLVVVPDIRFLNEVRYVTEHEGYMIWITRAGFPTDDPHLSECEWKQFKEWDRVIKSDGPKDNLKVEIAEVYTLLERRGTF
jgi:hypothetical protein